MPDTTPRFDGPSPAGLLTSLLRDVSRSFYLTLRVLPGAIRPQIGLAYLLARATDTIADTAIIAPARRLEALQQLRARISGGDAPVLDFGVFAKQQGSPGECVLLERIEEALALLARQNDSDRAMIQEVLGTITSGQELDLQRFAGATSRNIIPLQAEGELDDYTYRVAGCVGEFWTRICLAHLRPVPRAHPEGLIADGIRFGKGLQLVNILRDLSADLLQGRCYMPAPALAAAGLKPASLLLPASMEQFRPVYNACLDRALGHLTAGWAYTNALPYSWLRVRLACAWPILIGVRTLARLREANALDGTRRVKVPRGQVKKWMLASTLAAPFPTLWKSLFDKAVSASVR